MKHWILALPLVLLAGALPAESDANQHYVEGQRLFGEKNFEAALEEFKQADALIPKEPQVYSWIGACLNELGRYDEAEQRLEGAFEVLREVQRQAVLRQREAPPIDLNYFTLLALIRVNLREFDKAVETIGSFTFTDDGSEEATKTKQALEVSKQTLRARLVAVGSECLRLGELDCARGALTQADVLYRVTPSARESLARESASRADKAPAATDEEKAKRAQLFEQAVQAGRLWVEEASTSTEAQRLLARTLAGTKTNEGYDEAARILTSLWESTPGPSQRDSTIQLDLSVAQAGLEQWESSIASASTFIELNPDDARGQGYCVRSFAQFQLGRCPEAVEDGARCKNADGTARQLKHVEVCEQRRLKQEADKAAATARAQEAELERRCTHLYEQVRWARNVLGEIPLEDVVEILNDLRAREAACKSYLDAAEKRDSGKAFSSPVPELCAGGAKVAGHPFNLSMLSKPELEALRAKTQEFMRVCKSSLDASQVGSVEGGLRIIDQAIARP